MSDVSVWGDFEVHLDEVLGRGGMGAVYRARQRSLDRWVAVKVLEPFRAAGAPPAAGFLERFHVEARALARLQDPRIVTILQAGEDEGRCWFAMELIDGRTVEQRLSEEGAFAGEEAARVGAEVARALDSAWRRGILHRDVKPANIFLCRDGSVKLGDFGLARGGELSTTRITDANAVLCTPAYASPEQVEGRAVDHRSDIYGLGCVLYEMVAERPPFQGGSGMEVLFKHASETPASPRLLNPGVSPGLEAAILRCLRKDPGERYATYEELIRDLSLPPAAAAPRPWFWPAAAVAGAALFGVILSAVYFRRPEAPAPAPARIVEVRTAASPPLEIPAPAPPPPEPGLLEWLAGLRPSPEELRELDAFDETGAPPSTPLAARFAIEESRDHEDLPLGEALRRLEDEPQTGLLLPGIVRRECAAVTAAMERGEKRDLPPLPAWLEALAPRALAAVRRERAAMEAPDEVIFDLYAGTAAWRRLVRRALDEFHAAPRADLLREEWWFSRVPRPKENSSWKDGVLDDPVSSSTIERAAEHRGWRVEFSFRPAPGAADPAFFMIPGSVKPGLRYTLLRFRGGELAVVRRSGTRVETLAKVPVAEAERHTLEVVPRGGRVLVYFDGALAHLEEMEPDRAIRLSVQEGAAAIHTVEARLKD